MASHVQARFRPPHGSATPSRAVGPSRLSEPAVSCLKARRTPIPPASVLSIDRAARFSAGSPRSACKQKRPLRVTASFELPPIDGDLQESILDTGGVLDNDGLALTFGNDKEAIEAALNGTAVYNMSHFGRIRVAGDDRTRFLHNQTSADIQELNPGEGTWTVFLSPTARTVDLALAWVMERVVILTVSPLEKDKLLAMMDRYLFPADKVQLSDISEKTCQLAVMGPGCHEVMGLFGITGLEEAPFGTHRNFSVDGSPATVAVGSGLAAPGYTLMLSADVAGRVWSGLVKAGVLPMGEAVWNRLRVMQGRPAAGAELTHDYNPLEAGLWQTISTTKGCYIGQETIARLITYQGVKQGLWGIQFDAPVEPGTALFDCEGLKVGKVTSCVDGIIDGSFNALGYVKKLDPPASAGTPVVAEGRKGTLVDVPFLSRELKVPVST